MNFGTPTTSKTVRRVGLSRKRSSSLMGSPCLIPASPASPASPAQALHTPSIEEDSCTPSRSTTERLNSPSPFKNIKLSAAACPDLDTTLTSREQHLASLEKRLAALSDQSELENDISMWRNACKESLLDLQKSLLSSGDTTQMSCKSLAMRLGIWPVIKGQFSGDTELLASEDEETCSNSQD